MPDPKVLVILGQTATGKSDFAIKIAKKIGGEIISADSRQIYKGLDIGAGKITKREMRGVKHYLLDVASPKRKFSVVRFQKLAISAMAEILERGKVPIICGGTGFYIDAITKGISFPKVPPSSKFRKKLEGKSAQELFKMLKKLDPLRVKTIDQKNKVRLIRAIEIAQTLGKVPKITQDYPVYEFTKIGLYLPEKKLRSKIFTRLEKRIRKGMISEVEKLHESGLSWRRLHELGLEYRYVAMYLQGKLSKPELFQTLNTKIYQYAKRQMTWFKRDKQIKWLDASKKSHLSVYF